MNAPLFSMTPPPFEERYRYDIPPRVCVRWPEGRYADDMPETLMADANRAHYIAGVIETEIVASGWPVGRNLGIESQLARHYGVGRDVMRQAITLIVRGGLATVRQGRDGGVIVSAPTGEAASAALRSYLEITPPTLVDLMLVRRRFENLVVQLATERQAETETNEFKALVTDLETLPPGALEDFEARAFRAICAASRNPYLSLVALTFHAFSWSGARATTTASRKRHLQRIADLRVDQLRAMIAGDLAAALVANASILDESSRILHGMGSPNAARPTWGAELERVRGGGAKLGEQIADDIKRRVAIGEFSPGDRVGSEADLRTQYRASRGVVRDAIRLLEHLSLASTVRGPAGGLYVTAPSADSVLRTVGLYLRARGVSARVLMEVGEVLDPLVAEQAAQKFHAHPPEQARRILQRLEAMRSAPLRERSLSYYAALNELAATPLIGLLLPLQASLVEIDPADPAGGPRQDALVDRLMAAIEAGSPMLARSAMIAIRRGYRFHIPPPQSLSESPVLALLDPTTLQSAATEQSS